MAQCGYPTCAPFGPACRCPNPWIEFMSRETRRYREQNDGRRLSRRALQQRYWAAKNAGEFSPARHACKTDPRKLCRWRRERNGARFDQGVDISDDDAGEEQEEHNPPAPPAPPAKVPAPPAKVPAPPNKAPAPPAKAPAPPRGEEPEPVVVPVRVRPVGGGAFDYMSTYARDNVDKARKRGAPGASVWTARDRRIWLGKIAAIKSEEDLCRVTDEIHSGLPNLTPDASLSLFPPSGNTIPIYAQSMRRLLDFDEVTSLSGVVPAFKNVMYHHKVPILADSAILYLSEVEKFCKHHAGKPQMFAVVHETGHFISVRLDAEAKVVTVYDSTDRVSARGVNLDQSSQRRKARYNKCATFANHWAHQSSAQFAQWKWRQESVPSQGINNCALNAWWNTLHNAIPGAPFITDIDPKSEARQGAAMRRILLLAAVCGSFNMMLDLPLLQAAATCGLKVQTSYPKQSASKASTSSSRSGPAPSPKVSPKPGPSRSNPPRHVKPVLEAVEAGGQGNCFYLAVGKALEGVVDMPVSTLSRAQMLRNVVADGVTPEMLRNKCGEYAGQTEFEQFDIDNRDRRVAGKPARQSRLDQRLTWMDESVAPGVWNKLKLQCNVRVAREAAEELQGHIRRSSGKNVVWASQLEVELMQSWLAQIHGISLKHVSRLDNDEIARAIGRAEHDKVVVVVWEGRVHFKFVRRTADKQAVMRKQELLRDLGIRPKRTVKVTQPPVHSPSPRPKSSSSTPKKRTRESSPDEFSI